VNIENVTGRDLATDDPWLRAYANWLSGYSTNTQEAYHRAWRLFLGETGLHASQVTEDDAFDWGQWLLTAPTWRHRGDGTPVRHPPRSQSTINQHLSALSSFYTFAAERDMIAGNPFDGVKRRHVVPYGKATFMSITKGEDLAFLKQIDRETLIGKRDYAMLVLYLTTGLRLRAVADLTEGDIHQRAGSMRITYHEKGKGDVALDLEPVVATAINAYRSARGPVPDDAPLWRSTTTGGALTADGIRDRVIKYADMAFGPGHGLTPHSLRHTFALHAIQHGSIAEVSKLMRHSNTNITAIYLDHLDTERLDELRGQVSERYEDDLDADM